jgi:hypothetical protein
MYWKHGSSGREPTFQVQSPEFKSQSKKGREGGERKGRKEEGSKEGRKKIGTCKLAV